MRTLLRVVLVVLSGLPLAARADDCPAAQLVTYYRPDALPGGLDTRCQLDQGKCVKLEMKGYLFAPPPTAKRRPPYPIIIFNHGSGPHPGPACDLGSYFSGLGYLVLVPHRRGVGQSTGVDPAEYVRRLCSRPDDPGFCKMEYLRLQIQDVETAIAFARKQADVAPEQLALVGHSFGGILSEMANTRDLGQRAIVDFAGGSQSWDQNPNAVRELEQAVENAVAPMFFVEPMNDHSIQPVTELARVAGRACREHQSLLYPAIDVTGDGKIDAADYDPATSRDKAHGRSIRATEEWGAAVDEFIRRHVERPLRLMDRLCRGTSMVPRE
jgi:dienelactone hydrolase